MALITSRDLQLLEMATIASQMPLTFDNGSIWEVFKGECNGCGQSLPDRCLRGRVIPQTPQIFSIEASGVCHECRLLTRFIYRLHDDMSITGPRADGWQKWVARRSWMDRFRAAIKQWPSS